MSIEREIGGASPANSTARDAAPPATAREIVGRFGGPAKLARSLRQKESTVSMWTVRDAIPGKWHLALLHLAARSDVALEPCELQRSVLAEPAALE